MSTPQVRRTSMLVVFLLGSLAGACSVRQGDADHREYIGESCESSCSNGYDCNIQLLYDSAEECSADCVDSDRWDTLTQCSSRDLEFMRCYATLTCDELLEYTNFVMGGELSEDFPCAEQLAGYYNCDDDQPFESPE